MADSIEDIVSSAGMYEERTGSAVSKIKGSVGCHIKNWQCCPQGQGQSVGCHMASAVSKVKVSVSYHKELTGLFPRSGT